MKSQLIYLALGAMVCVMLAISLALPMDDEIASDTSMETTETTAPPTDVAVGDETIYGFYDVMQEINIDRDEVTELKKIENWAYGTRYTFKARGKKLVVYCDENQEIETVRLGTDTELYKRGYESWRIDQFCVSSDMENYLITVTKDLVRSYLTYPDDAKFSVMDWKVAREFSKYAVKSHVKVMTALGIRRDVEFTVVYWNNGLESKPIFFQLDGSTYINELDKYPMPERKRESDGQMPAGEFQITGTDLGTYGSMVEVNGKQQLWHDIPAGTYKVVCKSANCCVYVEKDDLSSGWVQSVGYYEWDCSGYVILTIQEDEHIRCSQGSILTLIAQ